MSSFLLVFVLATCHIACLVSLSQANECMGTATYKLTFVGEWSKNSHPKDFPSGAHFSPVVGCSHKAAYQMWNRGGKASPGVQQVAETGDKTKMKKEIQAQIELKHAYHLIEGSRLNSPGTKTVDGIKVNNEYPLVSVISMIAPSPDWFVGIHDMNFCNKTTGKWMNKYKRDLFPYDAGTDSGPNFASDDNPTSPHENIILMNNTIPGSFQGSNPIKRLGTFTFEKTAENNGTEKRNAALPAAGFRVSVLLTFLIASLLAMF